MLFDFGLLINLVLLILGAIWCYQMFGRWRSDLADLRDLDDKFQRAVIIGLWLITFVILALLVNFAVGLIANIVEGIRLV